MCNQESFNIRNRWKVRIDRTGADVLVVAPTGMGKVSVSYYVWDLLMLQESYFRASAFKSLRSLKLFVHPPFVPINEST